MTNINAQTASYAKITTTGNNQKTGTPQQGNNINAGNINIGGATFNFANLLSQYKNIGFGSGTADTLDAFANTQLTIDYDDGYLARHEESISYDYDRADEYNYNDDASPRDDKYRRDTRDNADSTQASNDKPHVKNTSVNEDGNQQINANQTIVSAMIQANLLGAGQSVFAENTQALNQTIATATQQSAIMNDASTGKQMGEGQAALNANQQQMAMARTGNMVHTPTMDNAQKINLNENITVKNDANIQDKNYISSLKNMNIPQNDEVKIDINNGGKNTQNLQMTMQVNQKSLLDAQLADDNMGTQKALTTLAPASTPTLDGHVELAKKGIQNNAKSADTPVLGFTPKEATAGHNLENNYNQATLHNMAKGDVSTVSTDAKTAKTAGQGQVSASPFTNITAGKQANDGMQNNLSTSMMGNRDEAQNIHNKAKNIAMSLNAKMPVSEPIFNPQTAPTSGNFSNDTARMGGSGEVSLNSTSPSNNDGNASTSSDGDNKQGSNNGQTANNIAAQAQQADKAKMPKNAALYRQQINHQLSDNIQKAIADGKDTISIQLKPAELGKVDVKIEMFDGKISVLAKVEKQDTFELLKQNAHELLENLKSIGIDVSSSDLNFEFKQQNKQGFDEFGMDFADRVIDDNNDGINDDDNHYFVENDQSGWRSDLASSDNMYENQVNISL